MAIYRGPGGPGDATNDATSQAILAAQSAQEAAASEAAAAASAVSASNSASAASGSATSASSSATSAATSASNAATSATNASNSATAAASSASAASTSATDAASSATSAATSATNAANSATAAASSATTAATQATNASNSATAAATSATNAANSASAAATSETNAANSASAASTSATNAASSATSASTSASTATTQASNAATSASDAATSASNAATSETNAATSASNAATSATNASNSATAASNSATSAAGSATSAAGSATAAASSATAASGFGFKNRIINGAMQVDQRNAGASVNNDNTGTLYTLDRWTAYGSVSSKFSIQQNAGSVTPPTGFINYLGITSLAATSVGSSEFYQLQQIIEGLNVSDLGWGTANAKAVTLSFWVYSSLTGTFGGSLVNSAVDRSYPYSYSVPVANTWTQVSVTIPGDTGGTWLTTNGIGIRVYFGLGVGSTRSGTAGSWAGADYRAPTGATSVVGTNGATFYITGVQLEKGSTATSFDYRPYGTELALCQRYFQVNGATGGNLGVAVGQAYGSGTASATYTLPVVMRTTPTLTIPAGATWTFLNSNFSGGAGGTIATSNSAQFGIVNFNLTGGSGLVAGNATQLVVSYHGFQLSAEL